MRSSRPVAVVSIVLLVIASLAALFPIVWAISTSFKNQRDAQSYPPDLVPAHPTLGNYGAILADPGFWSSATTSVVVTVAASLLTFVVAIPCAYALVRLRFAGKSVLVILILAVQTLPGIVLVVPLYSIALELQLYDTRTLLVIVYAAFLLPLSTWIIATFVRGIPAEVEEAALVDGTTRIQLLTHVVIPMIRPGLATAAIFTSLGAWNEFLTPVLLGDTNARPLTVYIASFVTQKTIEWGPLCAAVSLVLAPVIIVVVLLQRQLIAGLNAGSLKG